MSFEKLNKLTSSLMNHLDDSEKLVLPVLAAKAKNALNAHPDDTTLMSMTGVLARMAQKQTFISRGEFNTLYRGFYSRNNRFAELFATELGKTFDLKGPTLAKRSEDGSIETDFEKYVDPVLANALRSAFDANEPLKEYSDKVADVAKSKVETELGLMGLACETKVLGGSPSTILVIANFETPKGTTSIYVPIEVVGTGTGTKTLAPSCFLSNRGAEDFNQDNVSSYVKKNAGAKLEIAANQMLDMLARVAQNNTQISNIELAVTKLNSTRENVGDVGASAGIVNQQLDSSGVKDLELPIYNDQEISSFAERFDSPAGRAAFKFGERKVISTRNLLSAELNSLGYNPQIAISDCNDDTVTFAVSLGKTAFMVPCKMTVGTVIPNIMICNGSVKELSRQTINALMMKESLDYRAAASASPLYNVKPSELIEIIRTAMIERNFAKAEDALNILAQAGDEKAYQSGFTAYMGSLNKTASTVPVQNETKCVRIIANAHSKHEICGHTGLPLHKVYQDRHGDCHPLYRKGMDETYEGGYFMNSKIFG